MAIATRSGAYIGGHWIDGDGERIEVTSPGSGETIGSVTASSGAQVNAAVRAAADAFPAWRDTSPGHRQSNPRRNIYRERAYVLG